MPRVPPPPQASRAWARPCAYAHHFTKMATDGTTATSSGPSPPKRTHLHFSPDPIYHKQSDVRWVYPCLRFAGPPPMQRVVEGRLAHRGIIIDSAPIVVPSHPHAAMRCWTLRWFGNSFLPIDLYYGLHPDNATVVYCRRYAIFNHAYELYSCGALYVEFIGNVLSREPLILQITHEWAKAVYLFTHERNTSRDRIAAQIAYANNAQKNKIWRGIDGNGDRGRLGRRRAHSPSGTQCTVFNGDDTSAQVEVGQESEAARIAAIEAERIERRCRALLTRLQRPNQQHAPAPPGDLQQIIPPQPNPTGASSGRRRGADQFLASVR